MKNSSFLLRLGAATMALALVGLARADDNTTSSIKFSDSTKPGTLRLVLPWADVRVTGTDGSEVVVSSSLNDNNKAESRSDGLRRLDEEVSFELTEKNNVAVVSIVGGQAWGAQGSEFRIKVPRNTNLIVRTEVGGDIVVEKIDGDLDINCMNGEVTLSDISSSAIVNTMNGEIRATFSKAPVKPISFSTMNGEISLFLPKDTKANLRMRTHNGSILTDFGADLLKTKKESRSVEGDDEENEEHHAALAERDAARAERDAVRAGRDAVHAERHSASAAPAVAPVAPTAPEAPAANSRAGRAPRALGLKDLPPEERARLEEKIRRSVGEARDTTRLALTDALRAVARVPEALLSGHRRSSTFGKSVNGTLNEGGIDISLTSMNGTVTVRQIK